MYLFELSNFFISELLFTCLLCLNSGFIFVFFSMAAWMIDEFGSEELRQKFIPALASMEVLF